jgi:peptidoglycan hydrolase-like protein with peptidoglycan-binding domain
MAVLCASGIRLRSEVNQRWPYRDKDSDGWIGDLPHQERVSDHNANKRGIVDALDIDVDGIDVPFLVAVLIRHPSTHYVIWNRRIWTRESGFVSHNYTGDDPHTGHVHWSCLQSVSAENNTAPWGIFAGPAVVPVSYPTNPTSGPAGAWVQRLAVALPTLRRSSGTRGLTRELQALLNVEVGAHLSLDGGFGALTEQAVRSFQAAGGLGQDGVVGDHTWAALLGAVTTVRSGSKGTAVRLLQAMLRARNYSLDDDGDFGAHTEQAVRAFQSAFGLSVDGVAGPNTVTALLTR